MSRHANETSRHATETSRHASVMSRLHDSNVISTVYYILPYKYKHIITSVFSFLLSLTVKCNMGRFIFSECLKLFMLIKTKI